MTCIPEEVESKMIGKLLLAAAAVFVSAVVCDPLFSRLEYRQSRKNSKKLSGSGEKGEDPLWHPAD